MSQLDRWIRIAALVPVVVFGVATLVASGGGGCGAALCPEDPPPPGPVAPMGVFPQRYTFGGDVLPVEVRLENAVRAGQTATFTVSTTFPAGTVGLPGGLTIPAGQSVLRFNVSTTRVGVFLDGRVDVTWTNPDSGVTSGSSAPITGGQAATLMPEPTALQLSLAPNPVPGGQPLTLQVSVTPVYPVPIDITLSADSALVQVPPEIVIFGHAAGRSVQVATGATAAAQTVNVTARLRAQMAVESLQVTVTAATVLPSIAMQPQSQTVAVGSNTTFSVVAAGSDLVYQWQKNGTPIPGETDASLNLGNVQTAHAGSYTVVVSNFVGGAAINSITSSAATLTVTTTPPPPPPSGWQQVGPDVAQGNEQRMSIAVDSSVASMPTIVAATAVKVAGRVDLLVRRFDAANLSWTLVGNGPLNADTLVSTETFTPAIGIDSGGRISVAWAENGRQMRVKRWEGGVWATLADDLRVDPNALAFGPQISTPGGDLVLAWLETTGNVQGLGRMVMKRKGSGAQPWQGGPVLPTQSNVTALRITTYGVGRALLMFVPQDASVASFEGPLRVLREGNVGVWTDECGALVPPASASGVVSPNTQLGFGIGMLASGDTLAVFNNGSAVFALKCRAGGWTSIDGSAQGEVAAVGSGEALWGLVVSQGGNALAWSRVRFLTGGGTQLVTQVRVENATSTALAPTGDVFIQDSGSGFGFGLLTTLSFTAAGSPVLSGLLTRDSSTVSQVFRYLP